MNSVTPFFDAVFGFELLFTFQYYIELIYESFKNESFNQFL